VHAAPVRLVCIAIVLVCLTATSGLLAGCGSEEPHLPDVTTGAMVGPRSGEATIAGVAAVVLTYPDGHRRQVGSGVLEGGEDLGYGLKDLPSGSYSYALYGLATSSVPQDAAFPAAALVDENIVASASFVID
jgi:hypothetical protein